MPILESRGLPSFIHFLPFVSVGSSMSHSSYSSFHLDHAQAINGSVANLSSGWINNPDMFLSLPSLHRESVTAAFKCGFYCNFEHVDAGFAIVMFPPDDILPAELFPQVV